MRYLCETGMISHKWRRRYYSDPDEMRCKECKTVYDIEILGSTNCPRCGKVLKPIICSYRECIVCGIHG